MIPPAANPIEDSVNALVQRIKENRLILQETSSRLSEAAAVAVERRALAEGLRVQVRRSLERLQRSREDARTRPTPARASTPVLLPRHTAGESDPLDGLRQELHEAYAATGDAAIRAELLSSYDGFARSLALKFRHRESVDDLVQVARIGLLHAIDRFDPSLGRPFPLFARITIIGELKRHLRDKTWGMRVPRSLQEDYLNVMWAVDELTAEQSDSPSMEALAERCGMSLERVIEALELRVSRRALSIDSPPAAGADDPVPELGRDDAGFRQLEDRELLTQLLGRCQGVTVASSSCGSSTNSPRRRSPPRSRSARCVSRGSWPGRSAGCGCGPAPRWVRPAVRARSRP